MQQLINSAITPLISDGCISMRRVQSLIYIKEFIDRISTNQYLHEEDVARLEELYGVTPNVVSWGDYFQTEMATTLMSLTDEEFEKAVDTVRFDMMASWIIFCEKEEDFFMWTEETHAAIVSSEDHELSEEELEILHLKILMDYYVNLGLVDEFTNAERQWYDRYEEPKAM